MFYGCLVCIFFGAYFCSNIAVLLFNITVARETETLHHSHSINK